MPENPPAARLYQNQPNPYGKTTLIKYFIPQTATSAQLKVFSVTGQEVYSRELVVKGEGEVQFTRAFFAAGTYIYHLMVEGKDVDSKKLVLSW